MTTSKKSAKNKKATGRAPITEHEEWLLKVTVKAIGGLREDISDLAQHFKVEPDAIALHGRVESREEFVEQFLGAASALQVRAEGWLADGELSRAAAEALAAQLLLTHLLGKSLGLQLSKGLGRRTQARMAATTPRKKTQGLRNASIPMLIANYEAAKKAGKAYGWKKKTAAEYSVTTKTLTAHMFPKAKGAKEN